MRKAICSLLLCAACAEEPAEPECPGAPSDERLVVTADWLNGTLTLFGYDRLVDPLCSAEDAMVGTIDLSAYPPGPLELEITPDGTRALVSVGAGFLPSFGIGGDEVMPGGTLLVVDLVARMVLREIPHDKARMGMAMNPDGRTAYVAYYGTVGAPDTMMRVVDMELGAITAAVELGGIPEQISLSPDAAIGVVNVDGADGVRAFQTSDPLTTLSPVTMTGVDPSGSAFFAERRAIVANSVTLSLSIVDVSSPAAPVVDFTLPMTGLAIPYGITRLPETSTVLVTTQSDAGALAVVDAGSEPPAISHEIPLAGGSFPLVAAVGSQSRFAFVAHPSDRVLSIVDLEKRQARGVSWLTRPGPTYVAVQP